MLPHKHRLMLRHFPEFFTSAKKLHSPLFSVFYRISDVEECQIALIVPKKCVALSTGRNKIKRQVSAVLLPYCQKKSHLAIAIVVKKVLQPADVPTLLPMLANL